MAPPLAQQAERLYEVFAELVRGYQFRDREGICCHGVSVSQCYTLDTLGRRGPTSMGELADCLYLEISTMTRVVDQLVLRQLVAREADPKDRRICRIRITRKGKSLISKIRGELIKEHEMVLRNIPAQSREAVIDAMSNLLSACSGRTQQLSCERGGVRAKQSKAG